MQRDSGRELPTQSTRLTKFVHASAETDASSTSFTSVGKSISILSISILSFSSSCASYNSGNEGKERNEAKDALGNSVTPHGLNRERRRYTRRQAGGNAGKRPTESTGSDTDKNESNGILDCKHKQWQKTRGSTSIHSL